MKSLRVSFQFRGVQCRETVKLKPTKANIKYGGRLKSEIDRKIALGTFSYQDYFPNSKTKTAKLFSDKKMTLMVSESLHRYVASISRQLAPSTLTEYKSSVRIIAKGIGEKSVFEISTLELREWISTLTCSNKRINNMLVPLRGMFKDLYADGSVERDPMDRIKNLSIRKYEPEPFSQRELLAIIEAMPDIAANLVLFAAWTGLRSGELYALTWGDIDWNNKTCRVNKTLTGGELKQSTKTYASMRDVELLPNALEALTAQKPHSFMKGDQIWLHPVSLKPFTNDKQFRERVWQGVLKKIGIRYRPPYQLRHTFASTLLSAGANPMWVAKQMGHADWGMIRKVYGKWMRQEVSELERMAKKLGQNKHASADLQQIEK